ncbi:MAG: hypothetical protein P8104_02605 [Gammaproteobacteria bacterium]
MFRRFVPLKGCVHWVSFDVQTAFDVQAVFDVQTVFDVQAAFDAHAAFDSQATFEALGWQVYFHFELQMSVNDLKNSLVVCRKIVLERVLWLGWTCRFPEEHGEKVPRASVHLSEYLCQKALENYYLHRLCLAFARLYWHWRYPELD